MSTTTINDLLVIAARHPLGTPYRIDHDGFEGEVIGYYQTRGGKPGIALQLENRKVVHVYGEKWLQSP